MLLLPVGTVGEAATGVVGEVVARDLDWGAEALEDGAVDGDGAAVELGALTCRPLKDKEGVLGVDVESVVLT